MHDARPQAAESTCFLELYVMLTANMHYICSASLHRLGPPLPTHQRLVGRELGETAYNWGIIQTVPTPPQERIISVEQSAHSVHNIEPTCAGLTDWSSCLL